MRTEVKYERFKKFEKVNPREIITKSTYLNLLMSTSMHRIELNS